MPTFSAEFLQDTTARIYRACAVSEEESQIIAEHLVDAEACGLPSHGLLRVPQYVQAIAAGELVPGAALRVLPGTVAAAVLDAGHGFGQVMARQAMDRAIDRAERAGVGVMTVRNCGHTGRLGSYTEQATRRGMAGIVMVNGGGHGQWGAPFGASAGRLATNPLSIARPSAASGPPLLDRVARPPP